MNQSLEKIIIHIVFSTKNLRPYIFPKAKCKMYPLIKRLCEKNGAFVFGIGGTTDHVHMLVSTPKKITTDELLQNIKKETANCIRSLNSGYKDFDWQKGYGAFSIDSFSFDSVKRFILHQSKHHKQRCYKEEFVNLLKHHKVNFKNKNIWE